jgi:hypothetical protein
MADSNLKKIRAAYYAAGRAQPPEYDPLPSWETLSIQLREAFIHVWHDGHKHGAEEERGRSELRG